MPYAPDGNTCQTCKFYDVQAAQCHQRPPPFGFSAPTDGCSFWSPYSGPTRPLPTNQQETARTEPGGYVA